MTIGRRRLRPLVALLLGLAATGCDDWMTEPVRELGIEQVSPEPFRAGEAVEVRGPGVGRATVTLDGRPVEVLDRAPGWLRFRVDDLPECSLPLRRLELRAEAGDMDDAREVDTLGRPLVLDLEIGEHAIVPEAGAGCAVSVERRGRYGVAAYRTASFPVTMAARRIRRPFEVRLTGGGPSTGAAADAPAASIRNAGTGAPPAPPAPDLRPPPADAALDAATCRKEPVEPGDRLWLTSPWQDAETEYEVVSTSLHYSVLVELDSLRAYTGTRAARAETLADDLEQQVQPFLDRVFEAWPDADGDGRLHVLIGEESGASYSGGIGIYTDGCLGDFVRLGHAYMDDDRFMDALGTVVHEAMHWYDIGPDLTRQRTLQDWSTEAVASLARWLWRWEREGIDFWGNHGADFECPAGATCFRNFLEDRRYGWPGLSHDGGYGHGAYLVLYLVQQAVGPGSSPLPALGRLRHRRVPLLDVPGEPIRFGVAIAPLFEAISDAGRTELALQGEYLLSYYADDVVPGVSGRLTQYTWDIGNSGMHYPLRSFVLDGTTTEAEMRLALPDGLVFEVAALAGGVLTVEPANTSLALAVVRSR